MELPPAIEVPTTSNEELVNLILNFELLYERGEAEALTELFSQNAVTDVASGKPRILQEYQTDFRATELRRVQIENLGWLPEANGLRGAGDFRLWVWRNGASDPVMQAGRVELGVIRQQGRLVIDRLHFRVGAALFNPDGM